jgi:hypothetical protein
MCGPDAGALRPTTFKELPDMDRNLFVSFIVSYCESCGIKTPMDIVHGAPVEIDNVLFSLVHGDPIDPSLLLIVGEAGDPPDVDDARGWYALLLQNFAFAVRRGPVFSISPESGRLQLMQVEALDRVTPPLLAQRLEELAVQVRQWRQATFDAEPDEADECALARHGGLSINSAVRELGRR